MVTKTKRSRLSPALERRIEAHRAEVARLRAELGDPAEALDAFVRATFDRDALARAYQEQMEGRTIWEEAADDEDLDG